MKAKPGEKGADDWIDQFPQIGGIHRVHMKSKTLELNFAIVDAAGQ